MELVDVRVKSSYDEYYEDIDELHRVYGDVYKSIVTGYHKFGFSVRVFTTNGYVLNLTTGGDSNDIYHYDPFGPSWAEHLDAGLQDLCIDQFGTRLKKCIALLGVKGRGHGLHKDMMKLLCKYVQRVVIG